MGSNVPSQLFCSGKKFVSPYFTFSLPRTLPFLRSSSGKRNEKPFFVPPSALPARLTLSLSLSGLAGLVHLTALRTITAQLEGRTEISLSSSQSFQFSLPSSFHFDSLVMMYAVRVTNVFRVLHVEFLGELH